jgi:hypothetical protein
MWKGFLSRHTLILSSHLHCVLLSGLVPWHFLVNILYALLIYFHFCASFRLLFLVSDMAHQLIEQIKPETNSVTTTINTRSNRNTAQRVPDISRNFARLSFRPVTPPCTYHAGRHTLRHFILTMQVTLTTLQKHPCICPSIFLLP